jgi:hypothetical protein
MTYTHTNATFSPNLSEGENQILQHVGRWGSDGYPVRKLSAGRWIWDESFGVKGAPVVYKTKRAAVQAFERFVDVLIDRHAGRIS